MKLGVFGGTFDPPHVGHLIAAQDAWQALALDKVWFVPASVPPHKRESVATPAPIRLRMLEAAVAGDARFVVSDLELRRPGPSYTVDTLAELKERDPQGALFFLMGADQFAEFASWREPARIAELATVVVFGRPGFEVEAPGISIPYRRIEVTEIAISATQVRERVKAGLPIRYLVPAAVEDVIRREGLYK